MTQTVTFLNIQLNIITLIYKKYIKSTLNTVLHSRKSQLLSKLIPNTDKHDESLDFFIFKDLCKSKILTFSFFKELQENINFIDKVCNKSRKVNSLEYLKENNDFADFKNNKISKVNNLYKITKSIDLSDLIKHEIQKVKKFYENVLNVNLTDFIPNKISEVNILGV